MQQNYLLRRELIFHFIYFLANRDNILDRSILNCLRRLLVFRYCINHFSDLFVVILPGSGSFISVEERYAFKGKRDFIDVFEGIPHEVWRKGDVPQDHLQIGALVIADLQRLKQ